MGTIFLTIKWRTLNIQDWEVDNPVANLEGGGAEPLPLFFAQNLPSNGTCSKTQDLRQKIREFFAISGVGLRFLERAPLFEISGSATVIAIICVRLTFIVFSSNHLYVVAHTLHPFTLTEASQLVVKGLQNLGLYSVLRTFGQGGMICCDTRHRFFRPHPMDHLMQSPCTTRKGMLRPKSKTMCVYWHSIDPNFSTRL
jgi:hypothetical protein